MTFFCHKRQEIIYLYKHCLFMSLSLDSIRELNRLHLLVTSCSDPAGLQDNSRGSAFVWSVDLLSEGGLSLSAPLSVGQDLLSKAMTLDPNGKGFLHATASNISNLGSSLWGIVPQMDYARKYTFGGSQEVSFSAKCYLCLEEGLESDFFIPLLRLFFLAYPTRTDFGITLHSMADTLTQFSGNSNLKEFVDEVHSWLNKVQSLVSGKKSGDGVLGYAMREVGDVYSMVAPPTFNSWLNRSSQIRYNGRDVQYFSVEGSGLAVCYGNMYIPDVVITGIDVSVPKLYYHGGFPQVIEVSLSFKTLRVATSNLMFDIMRGRVTSK